MQSNPSTPQENFNRSHTSIKAFGVEFTGPSWVAVILIFAAIIAGIIYLTEIRNSNDATTHSNFVSSPADNGTSAGPSEQNSTTNENSGNTNSSSETANPPAAAPGAEDAK